MSANRTFSIYVRLRSGRFALRERIGSLDVAWASLLAFRRERFHHPERVILVDDITDEIVHTNDDPAAEVPSERGTGSAEPRDG